jgi:hypothetical protein
LRIENLKASDQEYLKRWVPEESLKSVAISWVVNHVIDTIAPQLSDTPEFIDHSTMQFGCGYATYGYFKFDTNDSTIKRDSSELWVDVQLVDLSNSDTNEYYLMLPQSQILKAGHGMCSGAFEYKYDHFYKIRFLLMDDCGNTDKNWSEWVLFNSPFTRESKY